LVIPERNYFVRNVKGTSVTYLKTGLAQQA
jgi:hypothetical protein